MLDMIILWLVHGFIYMLLLNLVDVANVKTLDWLALRIAAVFMAEL